MSTLHEEIDNGVAVLTLDNPPVNGLNHDLRRSLVQAIDRANADLQVRAVVLIGAGANFSAGADIREFGTPAMMADPSLPSVISVIEHSDKPVVAAIHGTCLGGGFETALGCHYRIATSDASFGLPEVKLGLLPGAGGTQRLPRLAGLDVATNMIVSGELVPAPALAMAGALDKLVDKKELRQAAVALALKVADVRPLPRVSDRSVQHADAEGYLGFMRTSVRNMAAAFPAPQKCIEALRAAVDKPFTQGLEVERRLFTELMFTPESQALRHFFFAERNAQRIEGLPDGTVGRTVEQVGVVGAGTMGAGIALCFLAAGIPVTLMELNEQALERGTQRIYQELQARVKKGKLKADKATRQGELLRGVLSYAELAPCDLIIEAVFEDMSVKQAVFRELDAVAKPGAILASNTSTLDLDQIAAATQRPADVVGLHFFSPANVMKLLEIVRGTHTAPEVLASAMALAKRIRKVAVVAQNCDGFIGNRMIDGYGRAAGFLLEEGASPQQIDQAMEKFGMAMGPFRMSDLAGNDISWAVRKRKIDENPQYRYATIADTLCEQGRFGQKAGKGWYLYDGGGRSYRRDHLVDEMIETHRRNLGITPRAIADEEIVSRCVLALVNEGARILDEGVAARASDIDLVYIYGYGFPVQRGGPMHYAQHLGLFEVERALGRHARHSYGDPKLYQPAQLISSLVAQGKTFS